MHSTILLECMLFLNTFSIECFFQFISVIISSWIISLHLTLPQGTGQHHDQVVLSILELLLHYPTLSGVARKMFNINIEYARLSRYMDRLDIREIYNRDHSILGCLRRIVFILLDCHGIMLLKVLTVLCKRIRLRTHNHPSKYHAPATPPISFPKAT